MFITVCRTARRSSLLTGRFTQSKPPNYMSLRFILIFPTIYNFFFNSTQQRPAGQGLLLHAVSRSHNGAPQSVGLLWT